MLPQVGKIVSGFKTGSAVTEEDLETAKDNIMKQWPGLKNYAKHLGNNPTWGFKKLSGLYVCMHVWVCIGGIRFCVVDGCAPVAYSSQLSQSQPVDVLLCCGVTAC